MVFLFMKKERLYFPILIFLLMLAGCVTSANHPVLRNTDLPNLIPRKSYFDRSAFKFDYRVSPDGNQIAWLAKHQNNTTLFVKTIGQDKIHMINTKTWCNIVWYRWAQDSRNLIYILDAGPKRARHIYCSDFQFPDADPVNLTPDAKGQARPISDILDDPDHILISQDDRSKDCFDLYKVNISSGSALLLARSEKDVVQWIVDRKGNLRGCIRAVLNNDRWLQTYDSEKETWETIGIWGPEDDIKFFGFTPDEKELWLLSNKGRDRVSLVRFNIESGTETLVCEDSDADIEHVSISRITGKALFAYSNPDYHKTYTFDAQMKKDLEAFKSDSPVGVKINDMNNQEQLWTVKVFDAKEESYFLFDRTTRKKQLLAKNQLLTGKEEFSEMRPVTINSRDNLSLRGYLTQPAGSGEKALPMVLLVHGGPWVRDYWKPNRMVGFLVNRGYAVLQVNYRGSSGYGRAFREAAINQFSKGMHNDLIDAVNWAINQKIADPKKIAIVGGSYGGFAAMAGLTFTPDVFTCGVSINGVSNWADFIESFPSDPPLYQKRGFEIWYKYLGNPKNIKERNRIEQRSPLFFTKQVTKPILIIYGELDKRVKPDQSEKMIAALRKDGKKVVNKKFETGDHDIGWNHDSLKMYREIEIFLARYLGGRSEG